MKDNQNVTLKKPKTNMAALALGAVSLVLGAGLINIATPNNASAAEKMAEVYIGATNLTFEPYEGFENARLRISGPEGYRTLKKFDSGEAMTVDLLSPDAFGPADGEPGWNAPLKAHTDLARGHYRYEVVYTLADGEKQTQSGSFFANDGIAFESPQAADLPIPPRYEGLPSAKGGKSAGGKVGLKQDFDNLVQILDAQNDDQTQLFWGNSNFANWRLDNRSGDLTAERFDNGGVVQLTLQADGDLGLRTTAPSDDLHILSDDGTPSLRLEGSSGEEDWQMVSGGSSTLQFDYEGTLGSTNDVLTIAHTGNVGIGAGLNPDKRLHVQGNDASQLAANSVMARIENSTGTTESRRMLELVNNGSPLFVYRNTATGEIWSQNPVGGQFTITKGGTGQQEFQMDGGGNLTIQGSLTQNSMRSSKQGFGAVDADTVLAKLDQLAIEEWSYKHTPDSRHMSPMAEEFYTTFGLGPKNGIAPTDLAGVALAAAKALKKENESLKSENQELRARLERIESKLGLTED